MRTVVEIIGVILLINGVGGLLSDDFGLLSNFADGTALTVLQVAAIAVGAALTGGSLLGRKAAKTHRRNAKESDNWAGEGIDDFL